MKLKLRNWVKVAVKILMLLLIFYIISSLFIEKEVVISEGKNYTCYGSKLLQVCNGENYE